MRKYLMNFQNKLSSGGDGFDTFGEITLDDTDNSLDLTGSPLTISFNNSSLNASSAFQRPNRWSDAESKYYPLKLKQARLVSIQFELILFAYRCMGAHKCISDCISLK